MATEMPDWLQLYCSECNCGTFSVRRHSCGSVCFVCAACNKSNTIEAEGQLPTLDDIPVKLEAVTNGNT